jgi:hypothetical protein
LLSWQQVVRSGRLCVSICLTMPFFGNRVSGFLFQEKIRILSCGLFVQQPFRNAKKQFPVSTTIELQ